MTKQTAVEWLVKDLIERHLIKEDDYVKTFINKSFEQAKAMEKEQIIEAVMYGDIRGKLETYMTAEEYYNETYNK
jgi:hypothetical protein